MTAEHELSIVLKTFEKNNSKNRSTTTTFKMYRVLVAADPFALYTLYTYIKSGVRSREILENILTKSPPLNVNY